MVNHCTIPLLGKRLRVIPQDSCGRIIDGAEYISTDGFVSITLDSEVEDGAEIIVRKASGALCVNEKRPNSFKRFTVELHFCGVNPALLGITTNAKPYIDGYTGDTTGYTVPEGEINKFFSLELWTGLSGGSCEPGAEEASGYILLPLVSAGVLGSIEITGEDAIDFSMTGASTKGGNSWGTGIFDVQLDEAGQPAVLNPGVDPFDHFLMIDTGIAPPPDSCEPQPIPVGIPATGATAGTPGAYTPSPSDRPADLAALQGGSVVADPVTAWTVGQYIPLSDGTKAHWDGDSWEAGEAPAP
jgi:hypothetical protein